MQIIMASAAAAIAERCQSTEDAHKKAMASEKLVSSGLASENADLRQRNRALAAQLDAALAQGTQTAVAAVSFKNERGTALGDVAVLQSRLEALEIDNSTLRARLAAFDAKKKKGEAAGAHSLDSASPGGSSAKSASANTMVVLPAGSVSKEHMRSVMRDVGLCLALEMRCDSLKQKVQDKVDRLETEAAAASRCVFSRYPLSLSLSLSSSPSFFLLLSANHNRLTLLSLSLSFSLSLLHIDVLMICQPK
jgi:chromosome segregation ATPase